MIDHHNNRGALVVRFKKDEQSICTPKRGSSFFVFFLLRRANAPKRSSLFFKKKTRAGVLLLQRAKPQPPTGLPCNGLHHVGTNPTQPWRPPPSTKSAQKINTIRLQIPRHLIRFVDLQHLHCAGYQHPRHLLEETSN